MARRKREQSRRVRLESLKQINLDAAGLDIGATEIWACVPEDRTSEPVRCFATFTLDLQRLAEWLESCGVTTVAMESTGVYWLPIIRDRLRVRRNCQIRIQVENWRDEQK